MTDLSANAERFSGFANLYDEVRPTPPAALGDLLRQYLGIEHPDVVDLGSGTGLSTRWAETWAATVVGVEPSADMRRRAGEAGDSGNGLATYVEGWSHETGLPDTCADVVLAVQALHWMDPEPTFAEVERVLRPGGIFAALDCDWPPSIGNRQAEAAWVSCRNSVAKFEARVHGGPEIDLPPTFYRDATNRTLAPGVRYWSKDDHLSRIEASGRFSFSREVILHQTEPGSADRFIALLRSQGDLQTLVKKGVTEREMGVEAFAGAVRAAVGSDPITFWFTYRVRLGMTARQTR